MTPVDGKVCLKSQEIVVIKCRATTVDCIVPGSPVAYECVNGVPTAASGPEAQATFRTPVSKGRVLVPRPVAAHADPRPKHYHHAPKSPLDALFKLFRAPAGHH